MRNSCVTIVATLISINCMAYNLNGTWYGKGSCITGVSMHKVNHKLDSAIINYTDTEQISQTDNGDYLTGSYKNTMKHFSDKAMRKTNDSHEKTYCVKVAGKDDRYPCTDADEPATKQSRIFNSNTLYSTYIEPGLHNNHVNYPFTICKTVLTRKKRIQ